MSIQLTSLNATLPNTEKIAVVFDFGGVVAKANRTQMAEFLMNSFGITATELRQAFEEMQNYTLKGGLENHFWEEYVLSKGKIFPSDWCSQFEKVIRQSLIEIPETIAMIKELQKQGYQTPLLSDMTQYQAEIIQKIGYYDLFYPVLLSYQTGVEKPNAKAFEILLAELKIPASSVLFIDDKIENVEAAKQQGIDSILFINPKQVKDELEKRGFNLSNVTIQE